MGGDALGLNGYSTYNSSVHSKSLLPEISRSDSLYVCAAIIIKMGLVMSGVAECSIHIF